MDTTANRIKKAMELRGLKQADIVAKTGISKGALSSYLSGKYQPKQNNTYLIAKVLDVNEAWLMGADVEMTRNKDHSISTSQSPANLFPIEVKKLPVLGEIACGTPKFAEENRESYVMVGTGISADFCLIAKGNSMINARIHDGDIVFVKQQNIVENGEIAVVIVNDEPEATLKRFNYYKEKQMVILKAENPAYEDMIFVGKELENIHILGKAIAFQSDVQ